MLVYVVDNKEWCPNERSLWFVRGQESDRVVIEAAITAGRAKAANWRFGGSTGRGGIIAILSEVEWLSEDYESTREFCARMVDEIFTQERWAALVEEVGANVVDLLVQAGVKPPTRTQADLGHGT
jgi:hypothetical protein